MGQDQGEVQKDKAEGKIKSAAGTVQQKFGEAIGSDEQQAKGAARDARGDAQHDTAQAKGWVQGATDSVVGTVKNVVGSVTGNSSQEAEGKAQQKTGDAGRAANE